MRFDDKISSGNIITVIVVAGTFLLGYGNLLATQTAQGEKLIGFEAASTALESRLRLVEIAQASVNSDIRSIQTGIEDIKRALISLDENGRLK